MEGSTLLLVDDLAAARLPGDRRLRTTDPARRVRLCRLLTSGPGVPRGELYGPAAVGSGRGSVPTKRSASTVGTARTLAGIAGAGNGGLPSSALRRWLSRAGVSMRRVAFPGLLRPYSGGEQAQGWNSGPSQSERAWLRAAPAVT